MDQESLPLHSSGASGGWHRPRNWLIAIAVLAGLLMLAAWQTQPDAAQPMPFPHEAMVQRGVQCLFCHTAATRSPAAGMPSVQKCMGCHDVIAVGSAHIQTLTDYWQREEPIPWHRINQLPRFVYFSHRVHLSAGLNCEGCHGDVGSMTVTKATVKLSMGWCIDCHRQQPEAGALTDCMTCHQ
jgi:hypothetical protein